MTSDLEELACKICGDTACINIQLERHDCCCKCRGHNQQIPPCSVCRYNKNLVKELTEIDEDVLIAIEPQETLALKIPSHKQEEVKKILSNPQQRELISDIVSLLVLEADFRRLQTYMINNHCDEPNYVILAKHKETKTIRPHLIGKRAKQMLVDYCDVHFTRTRVKSLPKRFKETISLFIMLFLREKGFRQVASFLITRFKNKQAFILLTLEQDRPKMGFIGDPDECQKIKEQYDSNVRKKALQYYSSSDHQY